MKNVIFDLDGCLIDSSEVQKAAFFGAYEEIVGDDNCPTYEEYIKYTGDSVDNVFKKLGLPASMAAPFRRISSESVDKIKVNWDAIDLVRSLKRNGCNIAICTGKDHDRTEDILKYYNVSELFDVLICADDVKSPKPSAEPIKKALENLCCSKEEAIVVGDGYSDIISAKRAGVRSVLVLWYGENGVPREADYTVKSVEELRTILQG
ncbi:HAD family hydrolase [Butyrivibrio sp. AC2005]|uniref:HAD family hydrolase n=1 Tax=Butyrivibrio sp. AC2005 TaxID=1280672 RepID=UPI000412500D|nr:HAD family hydrolase [Butyrivibrio sp. AC2005]